MGDRRTTCYKIKTWEFPIKESKTCLPRALGHPKYQTLKPPYYNNFFILFYFILGEELLWLMGEEFFFFLLRKKKKKVRRFDSWGWFSQYQAPNHLIFYLFFLFFFLFCPWGGRATPKGQTPFFLLGVAKPP
jgi:hypothetical protein